MTGAVVLLLSFAAGVPLGGAQLVTADGTRASAAIVAVDAAGQCIFRTAGQSRQIGLKEVVRWGAFSELAPGAVLVLRDGSLLAAELPVISPQSVRVDRSIVGSIVIDRQRVAGVVFRLPAQAEQRDAALDQLVLEPSKADRLTLLNGDILEGRLPGTVNGAVQFEASLGSVSISAGEIRLAAFSGAGGLAEPTASAPLAIGLTDGSRLLCDRLRIADGQLDMSWADKDHRLPLSAVSAIQPLAGAAAYLSDLPVLDYRHIPYLDLAWPYRLDRSVAGTWLRAGGSPYLKGLGVHSAARLSYALDGSYSRFEADVAIDDLTQGNGSVGFRVFVDGEPRYVSDVVRGGDAPQSVAVDVAGGKRLDLVVDFADRGDEQDRANWLDARLVR